MSGDWASACSRVLQWSWMWLPLRLSTSLKLIHRHTAHNHNWWPPPTQCLPTLMLSWTWLLWPCFWLLLTTAAVLSDWPQQQSNHCQFLCTPLHALVDRFIPVLKCLLLHWCDCKHHHLTVSLDYYHRSLCHHSKYGFLWWSCCLLQRLQSSQARQLCSPCDHDKHRDGLHHWQHSHGCDNWCHHATATISTMGHLSLRL
jgi:hypothetical protein